MPTLDPKHGHLTFKIVFWGPGRGGKTTVIRSIHEALPPARRGDLACLSTETERTLFFDFFPLLVGEVEGVAPPVRLNLFTVPGQCFYQGARNVVVDSADGVVFVADSRSGRETANVEALQELEEALALRGADAVPLVLLYNKRDAPDCLPVPRLRAILNPGGRPEFESVATRGLGLQKMLGTLCDLVVARHRSS